ncbi:MAG: CCA tRNA nucleotidyltransferase [Gemmatimonadota bacterium]|nr:MAG: CCA tRNA nucleotidyltransferase [Gemmatimonadota bacterium]
MNSTQENLARLQEMVSQEPAGAFIKELVGEFPESEVYLVGGMVRDAALGRVESKDLDVVIGGVPLNRLRSFLTSRGTVSLVGKTFGIFKFSPEGTDPRNQIDVALPRKEHSLVPGGYRDFRIQSDADLPIEEDLGRRDFTVNAMAWDWKASRLIDPFDGLEDIEKKRLRTVGSPHERFCEDYSRLLRAIRFSCQLGFDIDPQTWDAVKDRMRSINEYRGNRPEERLVPFEVIAKELLKAFVSDPLRSFDLFDQSGGFEHLMPEVLEMKGCPQPEMYHAEGDVWSHTRMALESLTSDEFQKQFGAESVDAELVMAVLFHDIGKPSTKKTPEKDGVDRIRFDKHDAVGAGLARTVCTRLKLSSPPSEEPLHVDPDNVWWLVKNHLLGIRSDLEHMKNSTIEKYFLKDEGQGQRLLKLIFSDGMATISPEGKPTVSNYFKLLDRVEQLRKIRDERQIFQPILSGHEIMEAFHLKPGPRIGELLDVLREEQLAGRIESRQEALDFLKGTLRRAGSCTSRSDMKGNVA